MLDLHRFYFLLSPSVLGLVDSSFILVASNPHSESMSVIDLVASHKLISSVQMDHTSLKAYCVRRSIE